MTFRKLTNLDMEAMEYDSVSTITLVSGWDCEAKSTLKFKSAVSTVMKLNPVLTGQLIKTNSGVKVMTGAFGVDDIFTVAKLPSHNVFKVPVSAAEKVEVLQKLAPKFSNSVKSGKNLLRDRSNIFQVSLLLLPSGCACYKVSICHVVADASTYYRVMGQLSDAWNGKESTSLLDWTPIPEAYPCKRPFPEFSLLDKLKACTTLLCLIFWDWLHRKGGKKRQDTCVVVDKRACAREKEEANDGTCKFLSTNDIVTATIAGISSAKNLLMVANLRGRQNQHPKLTSHAAGNYVKGIFFQGFDGSPCTIRKKLLNKETWSRNKHFLIQNILDNHTLCLVTNWVFFMTCVEGTGLTTVAHMPTMSAQSLPFDAAIIFRLDKSGTIAVLNNMGTIAHPIFLHQAKHKDSEKHLRN